MKAPASGSLKRDVIVIGSSAGGIEALIALTAGLPPTLPAALLVVQHLSETSPSLLSSILERRGRLSAVTAEDGMRLEHGRIYVAPPNRHLLVGSDGVRVVFGPRENRSRPAVDPLFRTAAVRCRSRVIGLILTGALSDGAAGLYAVARCGGVPLVQAPDDAAVPSMPTSALRRVPDARAAPLADLPRLLQELAGTPAPPPPDVPEYLQIEVRLTERAVAADNWNQVPGTPTRFTCPECAGAIQAIEENGERRYRCRVGHAYSAQDLIGEKSQALEETLWVALQTLEERADMLASMAHEDRARGWSHSAAYMESRAEETRGHADHLRDVLKGLKD